jgi:Xaa-Pro aminopeptidase
MGFAEHSLKINLFKNQEAAKFRKQSIKTAFDTASSNRRRKTTGDEHLPRSSIHNRVMSHQPPTKPQVIVTNEDEEGAENSDLSTYLSIKKQQWSGKKIGKRDVWHKHVIKVLRPASSYKTLGIDLSKYSSNFNRN